MAIFTQPVIVAITQNGVPQTGLSPTIRIRNVADNSLEITDAAMSEVGDGFYKYLFATYDSTKNYAIRVNTTLSGSDAFHFAGNESFVKDIQDGLGTEDKQDEILDTIADVAGGPIAEF